MALSSCDRTANHEQHFTFIIQLHSLLLGCRLLLLLSYQVLRYCFILHSIMRALAVNILSLLLGLVFGGLGVITGEGVTHLTHL